MRYVVVTTVNPPSEALEQVAAKLGDDWTLLVVADHKTPKDWHLSGARFMAMLDQRESGFELADLLPANHYSRKNLGYLEAIRAGAELILETDDDNHPYSSFGEDLAETVDGRMVEKRGWVNVYSHFTHARIWPRGLPFDAIDIYPEIAEAVRAGCPVQQFLADGDPDVDAIYRLAHGVVDFSFDEARPLILKPGAWSPFNSQNTAWWPAAYPYLYLPSFVSFRVTDIWRSFVAQRCLAEDGYSVAFHSPTVVQDRNAHSLVDDFAQEVVGYLRNGEIMDVLGALDLRGETAGGRLLRCYDALIALGVVPESELVLVEAWLTDLATSALVG